jgi:hypothetical protein
MVNAATYGSAINLSVSLMIRFGRAIFGCALPASLYQPVKF